MADVPPSPALTTALIDRLLRAHGLDPSGPIERPAGGVVNPCALTPRYAIRANRRDPHLPKFHNEAAICRLLVGADLPAPRVIALDAGREIAPWDVLITQRLPGETLEDAWPSLEPVARRALTLDAGRLLARIHQVPAPAFGSLAAPAPAARWGAALAKIAGRFAAEALALGAMSPAQASRLAEAIAQRRDALDAAPRVVVHRDFHLGNLLISEGQISGVLDFEWSVGGDPRWDLAELGDLPRWYPGFDVDVLLAGYREVSPRRYDSSEDEEIFALYRAVGATELSAVAARHWGDEKRAEQRERLRGALAVVRSGGG